MKSNATFRTKARVDGFALITLAVDDEVYNQLSPETAGTVNIEIVLSNAKKITVEQRKKAFELIYKVGCQLDRVSKIDKKKIDEYKGFYYRMFCKNRNIDTFSLSNCTSQEADDFIEMLEGEL